MVCGGMWGRRHRQSTPSLDQAAKGGGYFLGEDFNKLPVQWGRISLGRIVPILDWAAKGGGSLLGEDFAGQNCSQFRLGGLGERILYGEDFKTTASGEEALGRIVARKGYQPTEKEGVRHGLGRMSTHPYPWFERMLRYTRILV